MSKLTIYRGLPGSGKSTSAKALAAHQGNTVVLERDELRMELLGSYWTGNHEDEQEVTRVQLERLAVLLGTGVNVIISDTNLRDKYVRKFLKVASGQGATVGYVDLRDVPVETCIQRDALRERSVGEEVITTMHDKFIKGRDLNKQPEYTPPEIDEFAQHPPYVAPRENYDVEPVVLVDLDGTLADNSHRDPYDPTLYHKDGLNAHVHDTILGLHSIGYRIDVMTGRHEDYRQVVTDWLEEHAIPYTDLNMRQHKTRRDDLEKLDMFERHYRDNDDVVVKFAIDDRDRVVSAYRNVLKIPVLQANYGNF